MIGKKGAILGKIITNIPVLIFLFFLIAIYLAFTGGVFAIKGPNEVNDINSLDNLLLREINIEGNRINVFQGIVAFWEEKIDIYKLSDALKAVIEDGKCLAIAQGENEMPAGEPGGNAYNDIFIRNVRGEISLGSVGSRPLSLGLYERKGILNEISFFKGKIIYIQYYYGECLDE